MAIVYISLGVLFVPIGMLYSYYEKRFSIKEFFTIVLLSITTISLLFSTVYIFTQSDHILRFLFLWKEVMRVFFALEFGIIASLLLDIRSSKKYLPLITAGSFAASIWGSFSIPKLLFYIPIEAVLLIGSLYGILTTISYRLLVRKEALPHKKKSDRKGSIVKIILSNPYTITTTILGSILSGGVLLFFVQYLFFTELKIVYSNKIDMANFLANFYSIVNFFNLFAALFVAKLLNRFGVVFGIAILPFLFFALSSIFGTLGALGFGSLFFYGAVAMGFADRTVRLGIENPVQRTLYQMTNPAMRARSIGFRETIVKPLAVAIGAVITLVVTHFFGAHAIFLLISIFSALSLYVVFVHFKKRYRVALFNHINKRNDTAVVYDDEALELIASKLTSKNPVEVAYALEIISREKPSLLDGFLDEMIRGELLIRQKTIKIIGELKLTRFKEQIRLELQSESNPALLAELIGCYALLEDGDLSELDRFLHHSNYLVVQASFAAKIARDGADHAAATLLLNDLLESGDPFAYKLIASSPRVQHRELLEILLVKLQDQNEKFEAARAITAFGDGASDVLKTAFLTAKAFEEKHFLLKIISRTNSSKLIEFLADQIYIKEPEFKSIIYKTLAKSGFVLKKGTKELIKNEMSRASNLASFALYLPENFVHTKAQIPKLLDDTAVRIFDLLSIHFGSQRIERAKRVLNRGSKKEQDYAYELIDSMVGAASRAKFLLLISNSDVSKKIKRLANKTVKKTALKELIAQEQFLYAKWLVASAIYDMNEEQRALIRSDFDSELVKEAIRFHKKDLPVMKTTLEKVLILKSTQIFREIMEDQLAILARIINPREAQKDEIIITEGEMGSSVYIIASGSVSVIRADKLVATLGEREVFGELAVLDPEPRSATVVAKTDSLLYEITQEALYDLMIDAPQITEGIIKVLCQRIRAKS